MSTKITTNQVMKIRKLADEKAISYSPSPQFEECMQRMLKNIRSALRTKEQASQIIQVLIQCHNLFDFAETLYDENRLEILDNEVAVGRNSGFVRRFFEMVDAHVGDIDEAIETELIQKAREA